MDRVQERFAMSYIVYSTLKLSSSGSQVVQLQRSLPAWTSQEFISADGKFGKITESAVKAFQSAYGLDVDGIVGPSTAKALGIWKDVIRGFDASHWNTILWDKLDEDVAFCELKATEGIGYVDTSFVENVKSAKSKGLSVGAYHYTKFANSPLQESAFFLETVMPLGVDSVTLDFEYRNSGKTSDELYEWAMLFLVSLSAFYDISNIRIYTSRNVIHEFGLQGHDELAKFQLWAADWSNQPCVVPWECWETWQVTAQGSVSWAEGPIDLDLRII